MTQETIEEAAARYTCGWGEDDDEKAFIAGAKWMEEQMEKEQKIFGKRCFYKGFDKAENDDTDCFTA
jgi:hypothetical protein